ncbi:MAG: hypothetical protein HY892_15625 [Deltaproteobacteria bacterium]|nr:hypothetical protein [Deltaproteobacteria bacterium]
MRKGPQGFMVGLVCLAAVFFLSVSAANAFDKLTFGDQELTIYGWLRNNTGYFFEKQPYQQNDDRLATFRTWMRGYTDWKIADQVKFWAAVQFAYEPNYKVEDGSGTKDCYYCEYDNINDVLREVYLELKPNNKHNIKIGRQIAIWGESLTERVGDVVHPEDSRWTLAFANLEDTRIPQWMIRGIHDIDSIASSLEWIVNPLLTEDKYRVNRLADFAQPIANTAGQRFGLHPEDRFLPPNSVGNPLLFPQAPGVAGPPFSRGWSQVPAFVPGPLAGKWVPNEIPHVTEEFPDTWSDTRYGLRTSTTAGGYMFGFQYWHGHNYDPLVKRGGLTGNLIPAGPGVLLPERQYTLVHPYMDTIGAYMNKQLPWPGVVRAEAVYSPNKPFNTFDLNVQDAITRRDYYKFMLAYDLNNLLYFDWHKTAPWDLTLEYIGEYVPNSDDLQYIIYATKQPTYQSHFNGRISTNWLYNRIATELVVSYWPWGNSGLVMPAVKYMPGWLNQKFSFELKYIGVFGDNDYEGLGILRTKDMVVLTTQFNF